MTAVRRAAFAAALAALSLVAVLGLYGRALDYELAWMDEREIGQGEIVLAAGEPWTAAFTRPLHRAAAGQPANPYYRPLQIVAATAVHRVAGPLPRAYRALSLALGAAALFGFGLVAWGLFGRPELALAAVALAAAHPAGIEAWVWISGLGDALSAAFLMASLALALVALRADGGRALAAGAGALAAFAVALFAKEKGIATPALVAAIAVATLGPAAVRGEGRAAFVRGAALAGAMGALALGYLVAWRPLMLGSVALAASPIGGDRVTHLLSAVASWPSSLAWLVVPLHPSTSDAVRIVRWPADPAFLLGVALAIGSAFAAVWLWRRGRPVAALGLAWIWIAFLPTANLFPQIHARADRYLFLSAFGAALLVVDIARVVAGRLAPAGAAQRALAGGLVAVVALGWAQRTWARTPDWRSTLALFEHDVAADPSFREGRLHLASALFAAGRHAEADVHLQALAAGPDGTRWSYANPIGVRELACNNDLALGRAAQVASQQAALARTQPELAAQPGLRACRAQAEEKLGHVAEALAVYDELVAALPDAPPAAVSLAMARLHARAGQRDAARTRLEEARRNGPREPAFDWELRQVERLLR